MERLLVRCQASDATEVKEVDAWLFRRVLRMEEEGSCEDASVRRHPGGWTVELRCHPDHARRLQWLLEELELLGLSPAVSENAEAVRAPRAHA
ncbi:MAG: hypothetical protein WD844_04565 [Thermoleophilaceae bacterium]